MKNFFPLLQKSGRFSARIFLFIYILFATVVAGADFFLVYSQQKLITENLISEGRTIIRLFADNIRLGVFSENKELLKNSVEAVFTLKQVDHVIVLNNDGEILQKRSKFDDSGHRHAEPAAELDQIKSSAGRSTGIKFQETEDEIFFWAPVLLSSRQESLDSLYFDSSDTASLGDEVIGMVGLAVSKGTVQAWERSAYVKNILFVVLLLLIGFVMTMYVAGAMTRPLIDLVRLVREKTGIAGHDDEMNLLSETFVSLAARLEEAFETINNLKEGLEQRVRDRTMDLSRANRELVANKESLERANRDLQATMKELKEAQAQIVQSEKMAAIGQLVTGTTHEINNAITIISGAIPGLENKIAEYKEICGGLKKKHGSSGEDIKQVTEEIDDLVANIGEGVSRAAGIMGDLKNFAHGDVTSPDESKTEMIDLHANIDSTLHILSPEFGDRVEIIREYDTSLPYVMASGGPLNQVFVNLLINALHAIPGTGTITVRTWHDDERVYVSVKDSGIGIPEENAAKIFDPFFTTKPEGKGTGLGLGISLKIVKAWGGTITVDSRVDQGTEFIVSLPHI